MTRAVDTNGWHTVAAVTYADVNAAIKASGSRPASFTVVASDQSASANGSFGDWTLALGGAGPDINMQLQITGGSVTGPFGPSGAQTTLTVAPCLYPILVRAVYVPHSSTPNLHDLKLDDATPVQVGDFIGTQPTKSFLANAALKELLQQWLIANIGDFNAVFASVDLDADYANEGLKWLAPSYKGYAVSEPASGASMDTSVFAVLTLIDNEPPPGQLAYQVDPFAIPPGARAALLISPEKFLQHMMLAAVPAMFEGIQNDPPTNHFVIDNSGTRIRNSTDVTIPSVTLENGNTVEPSISPANFTIQIDTTELVIGITDMVFEWSAGVTVHLNYEGRSTLAYDKDKGLLDLAVTVQSGSGSVEVGEGLRIAEYITGALGIVASVTAGLGGYVSKVATAAVESASEAAISAAETVGVDAQVAEQATVTALRGLISGTPGEVSAIAARAVAVTRVATMGAFAFGLMPGIVQIMQAVADGKYQSLPKITDLTSAAIGKTVIWPKEVGEFDLDSAQLNGALQFGLVKKAA